MISVYTRKQVNETYYADPEPQPEIICMNPDNQLEFAYLGEPIDGFECREITQEALDEWVTVHEEKNRQMMEDMGLV
jgi:hypothetical protein